MLRTESPHDCYGAGHAGTALSAALGMAVARDRDGGKEHVVALAGDAAFTCGITYEALNNIAHHTRRMLVVLNDNEWSIDKNVGAIASYFHKIVTNPKYDYLHDQAAKFVEKLGGRIALRMARKAEEAAKSMLWPSVIFEELGMKYYGPIDGHDISTLIKTFEFLKTQDRPVLLHVLTQRAKASNRPSRSKRSSMAWARMIQPPVRPSPLPSVLTRKFRGHAGEAGFHEQQGRRDHRRHAQRHRPRPLPPPPSR